MKFVDNRPRMTTTNSRMPAHIRVFVTSFVDGSSPNLKGKLKMIHPNSCHPLSVSPKYDDSNSESFCMLSIVVFGGDVRRTEGVEGGSHAP